MLYSPLPPSLRSKLPLIQLGGAGERCKLPRPSGPDRTRPPNDIWCVWRWRMLLVRAIVEQSWSCVGGDKQCRVQLLAGQRYVSTGWPKTRHHFDTLYTGLVHRSIVCMLRSAFCQPFNKLTMMTMMMMMRRRRRRRTMMILASLKSPDWFAWLLALKN